MTVGINSQSNYFKMDCMHKFFICILMLLATCTSYAEGINARISIKRPGNESKSFQLHEEAGRLVFSEREAPVTITKQEYDENGDKVFKVALTASKTIYFNIGFETETGFETKDCDFYIPGFWYHKNLRSPKEAPSFHTSSSWNIREDRFSSPMVGAYDSASGKALTVFHEIDGHDDALTTAMNGEVILDGKTSLGYLGFDNETGKAKLTFGYPYIETPRRYIRKLSLAEPVWAFAKLGKGETISLVWRIRKEEAKSYGDFVANSWRYCFDRLGTEPINPPHSPEEMKAQLSNYFRASYVDKYPLKYNSGISIRCDDCKPNSQVQLGFCGRVLLNAFNAIEYGEETSQPDLVKIGNSIFDSFLEHGFTPAGYFFDELDFKVGFPAADKIAHSIRIQSEAIYATLHYLDYEKSHGRNHPEWEKRIVRLLDNLLTLQKTDGSFARKFHDNNSDIDSSGGSTSSATSTLVMGYKYFKDKKYLTAAQRTAEYIESNIIAKSDYFSSTLDANCEDKEAAISAVTATYYLAMVSKKKEMQHYVDLCEKAAYFASSWYYLWDVPFAQGQMLGDLGFKSRGWGNVSVENNHVDVFVFEFPHILSWLRQTTGNEYFMKLHDIIYSSLGQLLPQEGNLCGIGVPGFYPEVVQHTTWDYGKNGKGFYNNIFALGWTVASLWELYSPDRTQKFLSK